MDLVYVLAIDGGGTSTVGVIANEQGEIFAQVVAGKSNPTTMIIDEFAAVITDVLNRLKEQNEIAFEQVSSCFLGVSGVKELNIEMFTKNILLRYYAEDVSIIIENDACIALYSGTLGLPGIVQIAGTGAITYCKDLQQKEVRSGGWGYLFDDEGSGYDLAIQGLKAVFKAYDQRGPATGLALLFLQHFQVDEVPALIDSIYTGAHPRTIIAPLSKYVEQAAIEGDPIANKIIHEACAHYLDAIAACIGQTQWGSDKIPVVLAGGVFTNFELYNDLLTSRAKLRQLNCNFIQPKLLPIGGAVIGGLKQLNVHETATFVQTFSSQFHAH